MRLPLGRADEAQPTRCLLTEHAESNPRQPAHVSEQGEYRALPTPAGGANNLELKMVVARRHGKMLGRSVLGRPWAVVSSV